MNSRYGSLFQIDCFADAGSARRLDRVPLNGTKSDGGYDEAWLQRLIARHPQTLPIGQIEPVLEGARPVCLEMKTTAGYVDAVLVTPLGDIVLVECKLWRNPQARREVIGQIIDYAKELPRLS
jgi:RecB family endonuclease NucS